MTLSNLLSKVAGNHTLLAAKAGVHQTTISGWTRGAHIPPSTRIPALAAALGMDVAKLAALVARERSQRVVLPRRNGVRRGSRAGRRAGSCPESSNRGGAKVRQ